MLPAENASFHYYLSGALAMSDQTEAALAAARRAADLQKDSARFQSRIGWIYHRAKQYDQSQAAYAELVKRFESQHDSAEIREVLRNARLALSSLGVSQGNIPAAEEWLEQVLDEFPGDVGAMNDLGYLWADQNHHVARALGMIEQAVAAEPENMAYRDSLGWALFRLGRSREAVDELRKAAEVSEPDGVVLDHFGDALLANGDTPAAVAAWQRAVEAFGKDQETAKCRQTQTKIDKAANR